MKEAALGCVCEGSARKEWLNVEGTIWPFGGLDSPKRESGENSWVSMFPFSLCFLAHWDVKKQLHIPAVQLQSEPRAVPTPPSWIVPSKPGPNEASLSRFSSGLSHSYREVPNTVLKMWPNSLRPRTLQIKLCIKSVWDNFAVICNRDWPVRSINYRHVTLI